MDHFQLPEPLSLQGNLADNWRHWKQRFQLYITAFGKNEKSNEVKTATLLHLAGPDDLKVFNTFSFKTPGDENKVDMVLEKFDAHCEPWMNVTWERHVFNTRNQQPGETINQYGTDLRNKAKDLSEFGELTESLIKDRIVCGIASDKTRSRLLKQAKLTLSTALDICRADEATASQMKSMSSLAASATPPADEAEAPQDKKEPTHKTCPPTSVWILWRWTPVTSKMPCTWCLLQEVRSTKWKPLC